MMTIFYFLLALSILITFHEYGHFLVARWCGVKILRFSLGFGKPLFRFKDKKGTEFCLAPILLGGYVKMLDESEGPLSEKERPFSFEQQPLWARIAIVAAGPLANLLFAFAAFWLVLVVGIQSLAPIIDSVRPESMAARAGLLPQEEIIRVNQTPIDSWRDFQYALLPLLGSQQSVSLELLQRKTQQKRNVSLSLADWQLDNKNLSVLDSMGITPFLPSIPPIVGQVLEDSPGAKGGLQPADILLRMNDTPVKDWLTLVAYVKEHPHAILHLEVQRGEERKYLTLTIGEKEGQGYVGVASKPMDFPKGWLRTKRVHPLLAVDIAFKETVAFTTSTLVFLGRFITGQLQWQILSGPVGIAQGAGDSARSGFAYYVSFLGIVSISLGVLNLLPIPLLDGGHLLYFFLEALRRKPLSAKSKMQATYFGMLLLATIMLIALSNDIIRLIG
jgi:regulator of sigma E protease